MHPDYAISREPPWGDPDLLALAEAHALEAWGGRKKLAPDFIARFGAEQAAGRVIPLSLLHRERDQARLIGYNILGVSQNPLTLERVVGDWALYVHPDHRRSGLALELLKAQQAVAREVGADECYAGYVSCHNEAMQQLYLAAGFRKSMIGFSWKVKGI